MKKTILLGLLLLSVSCGKEHSPLQPATDGTIAIILATPASVEKSTSNSLQATEKATKPARLTELEIRVLASDNSVLTIKAFQPVNNSFNVSLKVKAQKDLKVLCLGKFDGTVGYFGIDEDVDVESGKTTTAVIEGWNDAYLSEIGDITPNPSPDGSYTVSWTEVPNTTIYTLQEADNDIFAGAKTVYSGPDLYYNISGKTTGTYYYQVQASNVYDIKSSWSDYKSIVVDLSAKTYTISGKVSGADSVTVILSGDALGSQIVNNGESYSFVVTEGGSYTITPTKTDYITTPSSQTFTNVTSNITANFTASYSPNTYIISGTVSGADSVTVTLSGDVSGSQVVNDGESYSFTVAEGGNYTVTPTKSGYTFAPASTNYNNVMSHIYRDFSAVQITYTISGTVSGLDGVTVILSGDKSEIQVVNDGGNYSFTVKYGGTYTITPDKSGYTFSPAGATFRDVTSNQTQNFTAQYTLTMVVYQQSDWGTTNPKVGKHTYDKDTLVSVTATPSTGYRFLYWTCSNPSYTVIDSTSSSTTVKIVRNLTINAMFEEIPTYSISGTISGADGVTITLSGDASGSQTVNNGGSYSFTVNRRGNYTITPSKSGYTFSPASQTFNNVTSNKTQDFITIYTLSGTITGTDNVMVTLSGSASGNQIVSDGGTYSFTVNSGGSYTVTPTKTGYTFTPASQTFNNVTSNQQQDFIASIVTYTISGTIMGTDGVTVTLSGNASGSQVVDDGGTYSFTVDSGGSYTITPTKSGYTFTPASQTFNNVTSNQTQNFTATILPMTESKIAFTSRREGKDEIYVMNSDGSNLYNLTNNPAGDAFPSWSPDATKIAFRSDRDGNWEIYVMNSDGSNQYNITNNSGGDWYSCWSPDGTKIAFSSSRDGDWDIYVINEDGSNLQNITSNLILDNAPSWSPDGTKMVFSTDRDTQNEIYIMNIDGSNPKNLTYNQAHDDDPCWSPDGTKIAFTSFRDGNHEIYIMNADGSNQINLTNNSAEDENPCWSPDGSMIAFWSDRDGNREIYVINADGSNQINLTNNSAEDNQPSWSPF